MDSSIEYHLNELRIVRDKSDPRRSLPELEPEENKILDVGCGIGQSLLADEISGAELRCGVDVDDEAIAYGKVHFPELDLRVANAEKLPFQSNFFDFVFSRVALPYTNLPLALSEIYRVLRPGARVWALMHPWRVEKDRLIRSLQTGSVRAVIDSAYVCLNSVSVNVLCTSFARPWSGRHESFQTVAGARRLLENAGFRLSVHDGDSGLRVLGTKP